MHSFYILSIHRNVFYHRKYHGHVGIKKEIGPFPNKDHLFFMFNVVSFTASNVCGILSFSCCSK